MRLLRLLPLLALPLLFLGATCVTRVDQKGPAGPWIGEVTNTGPAPATVMISAVAVGADGYHVYPFWQEPCPPVLLPGMTGSFELVVPDEFLSFSTTKQPLSIAPFPVAYSYPAWSILPTGVPVRLIREYPEHNGVIAQVTNDSASTLQETKVCANVRDASGRMVEVGFGKLFPSSLGPGESRQLPIYFNSLPEGNIEFFVSAKDEPYGPRTLPASRLEISATKVVHTAQGRELQGIGEIHSDPDVPLFGLQFQLRLASSPTVIYQGDVLRGQWLVGTDAPITFTLPLDSTDSDAVEVMGIEGWPSIVEVEPIQAEDVTRERVSSDTWKVTATFTNHTSERTSVAYFFNLRGDQQRLVGTTGVVSDLVQPGATLTVSRTITTFGFPTSLEIVAYSSSSLYIVPPTWLYRNRQHACPDRETPAALTVGVSKSPF